MWEQICESAQEAQRTEFRSGFRAFGDVYRVQIIINFCAKASKRFFYALDVSTGAQYLRMSVTIYTTPFILT